MDNCRTVFMIMLDISVAFNSLDHNIMIERRGKTQGLGSRVTDWFESYLRGRIQKVSVDGSTSLHLYFFDGAVQE